MFGTGDVYLACALLESFKQYHDRLDVELVVKAHDAPIADLFDHTYTIDDHLVIFAENHPDFQRTYENVLLKDERPFYVHPSFVRSGARIDQLTAHYHASQADMYRVLLGLPHYVPLAAPCNLPTPPRDPGTVLLVPEARSWPNHWPWFWDNLNYALTRAGYSTRRNNPAWSLGDLFACAAASDWVIGPQCGVMSILTAAAFPCRKSLVTPSVDGGKQHPWAFDTYPYAYVTKFTGNDYDADEFKLTEHNHEEVIAALLAVGTRTASPGPVLTVQASLSPGDVLDRLAVLAVKRARLGAIERALIEREYQRFTELRRVLPANPQADALYGELEALHLRTFDLLETLVPASLSENAVATNEHLYAVRLNRERVALKQALDVAYGAAYTEVKSYYRGDHST
jgi:hypothetical protein